MSLKLRRMWIQLTSDRKRFATLCVALGVGMLLWSRLIVVSKMPRTAIAEDAADSTGESQDSKTLGFQLGPENRSGQLSGTAVPLRIELSPSASRDPFVISPVHFPKPTSFTEVTQEAGKSQVQATEEPYQIELRRTAQLQSMAERLRLEAAVAGSLVVISGKTYRVGDWIPTVAPTRAEVGGGTPGSGPVQFRLEEVRHRSAILECEGRRFEIQMALPGS